MGNRRYGLIVIWVAGIGVLLTSSVLAQFTQGRKELAAEKLSRTFALQRDRPLTVVVNNIGENGVVCLEAKDKADEAEIKASAIHYNEKVNARIEWLKIERIAPLSDDEVLFSNNSLTVDGHAASNKRIVVHLSFPIQTQLTLFVNGKRVENEYLSGSVMIQNGEVVTQPEVGPGNYSFEAAVIQTVRLKYNGK